MSNIKKYMLTMILMIIALVVFIPTQVNARTLSIGDNLKISENDIIENEQENELSNYGAENNLETIRKRKENLIKLKQELIDSERNKETTEEPKTKSMK